MAVCVGTTQAALLLRNHVYDVDAGVCSEQSALHIAATKWGRDFLIGAERGFSNGISSRGEREGERLTRIGEGRNGFCNTQ